MSKMPAQPIEDGRFVANAVVRKLLAVARQHGVGLNELADLAEDAPHEHWAQFYQLNRL
jgi:hypothetical protein